MAIIAALAGSASADDHKPWQPYVAAFARHAESPFPADNAYSPEREHLGRVLFFDPRLSGAQSLSCATCHDPARSFSDGLARGVGHDQRPLDRRTPTLLNGAFAAALFWDGRAASLETQALIPIAASREMDLDAATMVSRLESNPEYVEMFAAAYPGEDISTATVAKALATFERTIVSSIAPFDRFIRGETDAISEAARRGFVVFNTTGRCAKCHSSWRFSDDSFWDVGLAGDDLGRGKIVPLPSVQHAFKTPTLRNVDRRGPYMHDGSEATLDAVIDLYDQGGRVKRPSLSPEIRPLHLSARDRSDLMAFMHTLTSEDPPIAAPALPQ